MLDTNDSRKAKGDGAAQATAGATKSNNKKRTYEEAFPLSANEPTIEEVLNQLKQRVLVGESLNNFKREVSQLVELIEKKDP